MPDLMGMRQFKIGLIQKIKMQFSESRENRHLPLQFPRLTIRETNDNKNISCYTNGLQKAEFIVLWTLYWESSKS